MNLTIRRTDCEQIMISESFVDFTGSIGRFSDSLKNYINSEWRTGEPRLRKQNGYEDNRSVQ